MTDDRHRDDAVLAALERANPLPNADALEGPDAPRARALLASITGAPTSPEPAAVRVLHDHVRLEVGDRIATLRFDDGKVNVLSRDVLGAFEEALRICEADAEIAALVLVGRPGHWSAGLDRRVFLGPPGEARDLLARVARLVARIYASKLPVVAACTGHAIAAGALLLLAADVRVAARGDYKIGLNETAIGLMLPRWAVALARERLARQEVQRATLMARLYAPDDARAAGFVDRVVEARELPASAREEAERLAALDPEAYAATARTTRADAIARIEAFILEDFGA